jgi:hypothetical protein
MTPFALGQAVVVRAVDGSVRAVDDSTVTPGVLGFVVVALLGVATWLLVRSMTRQMKKIDIPPEGTATRPPAPPEADAGADAAGGAGGADGADGRGPEERGSAQR